MSDSTFQRENRYIIIKRSDLKKVPVGYRSSLVDPMFSLLSHLPHREFLVVESDWPEAPSTAGLFRFCLYAQLASRNTSAFCRCTGLCHVISR
ncbi:hypothetical protein [Pseudomonas sp. NFX98]|uniref:hypothetical protein n=1 Tax=Pseudomonas sp. NFX98 TaxID=3399122 RepID=UPI0039FD38F3